MTEARNSQRARRPALLLGAMALAVLSGCALGPDYKRPALALEGGFINAGASGVNAEQTSADIATFWRGFNDGALSALIERAIAANGDVRLAQARLQEARANQGETDAAGGPGVGVDANATRAIRPITQQPGAWRSARTGNTFDTGFIANWELDLFGRYKRGSEAAAARTDASQASLYAAHTSVAAEVARNYLELRGLQQRLRIAQAALVNQRDAMRITDARVDAGRGQSGIEPRNRS